MRKIFITVILLSLIFLIYPQDNTRKGYISALKGDAKKRKMDESEWLEATLKMNIQSRDVVRTLPKSFAEIALGPDTRIRLAPKTIVNMIKLYEETEDKKITKMQIKKGEIWGNVNNAEEKEVFEFESTAISSSVVGTVFRIQTHKDGSKIKVYKGRVEVTGKVKRDKKDDKQNEDYKIKKPKEIEGPKEVKGPKEVTMKEWTVIVKKMMELEVNKEGEIINYSKINKKAEDSKSKWYKWNKKLDKDLIKK